MNINEKKEAINQLADSMGIPRGSYHFSRFADQDWFTECKDEVPGSEDFNLKAYLILKSE